MRGRGRRALVESLKASMPNVEEKLDYYRKLDCKGWNDRDFFEVLTRSVFTGIRDDIIESRWPAVKTAFSDFNFKKVAKYDGKDIKKLVSNPDMIRHKGRIRATIKNARKTKEIVEEYGSFLNYMNSFKNPDDLIADLQEQFDFIGEINVYVRLSKSDEGKRCLVLHRNFESNCFTYTISKHRSFFRKRNSET